MFDDIYCTLYCHRQTGLDFVSHLSVGQVLSDQNWLPERDLYLSNGLDINKTATYFIVRVASVHGNLLAQHQNLAVPVKRTVLSVEPCL
jgi:hypothetical protein